jgi:glycosyltransferase involved in cell wall biosynthesis
MRFTNPVVTLKTTGVYKNFLGSASNSFVKQKDTIVLIGNYRPDKQESMIRFANMLKVGFTNENTNVVMWAPPVLFGKFSRSTTSGIGKWLGYIDKWIVSALALQWKVVKYFLLNRKAHFHICDHSNAPYLSFLPQKKTVITCHDVLAIRGALGFKDAFCPASTTGKFLQKWILKHLSVAHKIACVSNQTLQHLKEIVPDEVCKKKRIVIHNSFNANFHPIAKENAQQIVHAKEITLHSNYVLHVGSALPRKNRKLLLDMVALLGSGYNGQIYFAGEDIDKELLHYAEQLGLKERIVSIVKPDHLTLLALYSSCDAFVFPSFSEGFGWPVIEAQACGAPVIASKLEPMLEIGGGAALHANPYEPKEFADAFLSLKDNVIRNSLIRKGFENIQRFQEDAIIKEYLNLHQLEIN